MELRKFKHAEMMLQWLTDPSLELQYEYPPGSWLTTNSPTWGKETNYRFKPKTIRIGEFDVPEPVRIAPKYDDKYWVPLITNCSLLATTSNWRDGSYDYDMFKKGMIHLSCEDAEIHARALISLTAHKN